MMGRWGGRDSPFGEARDGGKGSGIAGHSTGRRATAQNSFRKQESISLPKEKRDTSLEGLKSEYVLVEKEINSQVMPSQGLRNKYLKLYHQIKAKEGK